MCAREYRRYITYYSKWRPLESGILACLVQISSSSRQDSGVDLGAVGSKAVRGVAARVYYALGL